MYDIINRKNKGGIEGYQISKYRSDEKSLVEEIRRKAKSQIQIVKSFDNYLFEVKNSMSKNKI